MTIPTKPLRGFARLSPDQRRAMAAKGGAAVPADKRSFSQDRWLAMEAGTKGGMETARRFRKGQPSK